MKIILISLEIKAFKDFLDFGKPHDPEANNWQEFALYAIKQSINIDLLLLGLNNHYVVNLVS